MVSRLIFSLCIFPWDPPSFMHIVCMTGKCYHIPYIFTEGIKFDCDSRGNVARHDERNLVLSSVLTPSVVILNLLIDYTGSHDHDFSL